MTATRIDVLRRVMKTRRWALFQHGSIVFVPDPDHDVAGRALEVMKEYGPVLAGSPAGDFSVIALPDELGWAVASHHPDLLTLVLRAELGEEPTEVAVGLVGRGKRDDDAREPVIAHVEDA